MSSKQFLSKVIIRIKMLKQVLGYSLLLSVILLFAACSSEQNDDALDDNDDVVLENGFTLENNSYETPNGYLIFHTALQYDPVAMEDVYRVKNHFSFLFMEGSAIINEREILYSVDTKHNIYHYFRDIGAELLVDDIQSIAIAPDSYIQSAGTTTRVDISDIDQEVTQNGLGYGDPVFAGINYPIADNDIASFTINSIDVDYASMTGTIDCEYSIDSEFASGEITGKYIGTFDILVR